MTGYIQVADFIRGKHEIGEWRVRPFPFVTHIKHTEIEKAGVKLIVVKRTSFRTSTIDIELRDVELPSYCKGRLRESWSARMEPNSVFGYTSFEGRCFWFPMGDLEKPDQVAVKWAERARVYAATICLENKAAEDSGWNNDVSSPVEGGLEQDERLFEQAARRLERVLRYYETLEKFSSNPPQISAEEITRFTEFILNLPGLVIKYYLK